MGSMKGRGTSSAPAGGKTSLTEPPDPEAATGHAAATSTGEATNAG
jgi:hypothetical protein